MNLTDSTCDFGLAQVDGECSRTFASFDDSAYLRSQIIFLSVGVVSVVASSFLYWRAASYGAAKLQQHSLFLCVYASLTFIFRSVDSNGYKHTIPYPIVSFVSDSCTAALYTIFYWASVIQRGAAHIQRAFDFTPFVWAVLVLVWVFHLAINMCLFLTKGFYKPLMTNLQLLVSAGILLVIGIAFFVYGMRVRSRLRQFEHQRILVDYRDNSSRAYELTDSSRPIADQPIADGSNNSNNTQTDAEVTKSSRSELEIVTSSDLEAGKSKRVRSETKEATNSHSNKILKIVIVVSVFVVVVVAAQVYICLTRSNGSNAELDCANGLGCDGVKSSISLLHWLQMVAVWVILWVFHKVERRRSRTLTT